MKRLIDRGSPTLASVVIFALVITLGGVTLNWLKVGSNEKAMDCARFSRVVLMGFAVSNPDYSMKFSLGPSDECELDSSFKNKPPPFDGSLQVGIGPRVAGPWPYDAPALLAEFRQDPSGEIHTPLPEPWYLTDILTSFGDEDAGTSNRQTSDLLKGMSWRRHRVHAVVEFKEPLSEEEANEIHAIHLGETALLSPGHEKKPIGWPFVYPGTIGNFDASAGQKSTSRVSEFQRWVSLLQPEDNTALEEIGLDLTDLRSRANDGLIYGFTIINTPEVVTHIAKNPKVRSVRVIEIVPQE